MVSNNPQVSLDSRRLGSEEQSNAYLPPGPPPLVFEDFQGINTRTNRAGVPDQQAYWIDGFMPIDRRRLRSLYGLGPAIYGAPPGTSIVFFDFYNIGTVAYSCVFLSNGQVQQCRLSDSATVNILNAGNISSPSILNQDISQWGREYLIIVSDQTNGYFIWDGSNVYGASTMAPVVSVVSAGGGYVSAPTVVVIGGHGSGASVTVSINSQGQIVSGSVVNAGSGYHANDTIFATLTPAPTGGSGGTVAVSGTMVQFDSSRWSVAALTITAVGSLYSNPTLVFTHAGQIVTAQGVLTVSAGSLASVSLTGGGQYNSSLAPTVTITDSATAGSISVYLMPFGVQGTSVETYQQRVWVSKQTTLYWTGPGSFFNFATSIGGGNNTVGDSYVKSFYSKLISANGFLYLIGDSSVDYISGVTTSGSPPTTTFSRINADPEIGSPYPQSVQLFGRNPMFANSLGVYVVYGADVKKVSDHLDGVWNSVAAFGGLQLSGAKANIFGRKVWMELARIVDPISGSTVNKACMWDGNKWWTSEQDALMTYCKGQEINSVFTAYSTDGTFIQPMFSSMSTLFVRTAQSKLWDPGGMLMEKTVDRFWGAYKVNSTLSASLSLVVDSVINNEGTLIASTAGYTISNPNSVGIFAVGPMAVGQRGEFFGMTLSSRAADIEIITAAFGAQAPIYRG